MSNYEQKLAAVTRIFPKLSAYGRAIEAGGDGVQQLDALRAEMLQSPEDMWYAIEQAKSFQRLMTKAPFGTNHIEDHKRAPQRLVRLKKLGEYFDSPEFTGVDLAM